MKTPVLIFLFIINALLFFAQNDTNKVLKYTVKSSGATYKIFPEDNYLFVDSRNKIKIITSDKIKKYELKITNGMITKSNNDSIYIITNTIAGPALLSIFEVDKNNKRKLVMNKEYKVIGYPQLMWNGVKSDSVITRLMLNGGKFYAIDKKVGRLEVESFKMDILYNGEFTTDSVIGNRVSPKMRKYITDIKEGSIVYIKDVKYHTLNGKLKVEPIFRLFIGKNEEAPYLLQLGGQ